MEKANLGTARDDAPLVVALGPGFAASVDCHAVVETKRGHNLGRVISEGQTEPAYVRAMVNIPSGSGGMDCLFISPVDPPIVDSDQSRYEDEREAGRLHRPRR